jgi:hypothetical protein
MLASCGNKSDELIPLEIGNIWYYDYQRYNSDGSAGETNTFTLCVLADSIINNDKYWVVESGNLWTNRSDGVYSYVENESPFLMMKYPAIKGEYFGNAAVDSMQVVSVDSKVKTPAGEFSCYEYHMPNPSYVGALTVIKAKPGVGIVQIEEFNKSFENDSIFLISRMTLNYYKLQ